MTIRIVGAGAVGLNIGGRLAHAGHEVVFVVRRPEAARSINERGVQVSDLLADREFRVTVSARVGLRDRAVWNSRGPVLLCVRAIDTEVCASEIAAVNPGATVVSVQNDVDNEERLARRFVRVFGVAFRQTSTRVADDAVRVLGSRRLVIGLHPEGADREVDELAGQLRTAGFDVGVSERIGEDKWLKLCVNLMSAPNALVRKSDHETRAFVETKARLLEEAHAVLARAGIVARSCDGRDRSLLEEIRHQRDSLTEGASSRSLPVYNQVWAALRKGDRAPVEADRYHRRILALASRHGASAPVNARVLAVLKRVVASGAGPESVRIEELATD